MIQYSSNDMAKLGCNACSGCSACCKSMGQSILLDPYDIYQIQAATGLGFAQLMQGQAELHVEEGLILPSLKMQEDTDACGFLDREGRCSIHAYRPGLCRLFPLGRRYEGDKLWYFVLEDACQVQNRTKVKIKKWLDVKSLTDYERFLVLWHDLRRRIQEQILERRSDTYAQKINVDILQIFYQTPYDVAVDFYSQFRGRMGQMESVSLDIIL